jgi:uncharacterized protein YdaT
MTEGGNEMPWTKNNYPDSMKNLEDSVREKAVEIANALLEEGYEDSRAIPIAISGAKEWSENRGGDVSSDITHHLTPGKAGWLLKSVEGDEHENFKTKEEAMDHIKTMAKTRSMKVMIHDAEGNFQKVY